jgi:hypothetical protein
LNVERVDRLIVSLSAFSDPMSCPDVASCLGIVNDGGIVTCDLQNKLTDIECDTDKISKDIKCIKRTCGRDNRCWLILLTILFIIFFVFLILVWFHMCKLLKDVKVIKDSLSCAPWLPCPAPPCAAPPPPKTNVIIKREAPPQQPNTVVAMLPPQATSAQLVSQPPTAPGPAPQALYYTYNQPQFVPFGTGVGGVPMLGGPNVDVASINSSAKPVAQNQASPLGGGFRFGGGGGGVAHNATTARGWSSPLVSQNANMMTDRNGNRVRVTVGQQSTRRA